jgi:hypothetical protein
MGLYNIIVEPCIQSVFLVVLFGWFGFLNMCMIVDVCINKIRSVR